VTASTARSVSLAGRMLDFGAYLERIGLSAGVTPTLSAIHRAHATSIPFENLDPHRGIPISLAHEDLERKLVHDRRGGYCFEHNMLLAAALEHLGLTVERMLARVRAGAPPGTVRPRSHLVLRVSDGVGVWHADVGFGLGTLLDPIPFGPDAARVRPPSGRRSRVDQRLERTSCADDAVARRDRRLSSAARRDPGASRRPFRPPGLRARHRWSRALTPVHIVT
jgi:arylamine N-acetyltransferase